MASEAPIIQILAKDNYEEQHIVTLPATASSPLPPSSLRIKSSVLSLTTNNLSYAKIGHLVGWWDVHPLPASTPAELSDPTAYGRISAWGYGTVIESTVAELEQGAQVYGYLPIGTLPVDMEVQVSAAVPGQFLEVSKARENVMPIYNRYWYHPAFSTPATKDQLQQQGYDAVFKVFFETGYMMNRFVFAWEPTELVQTSGYTDGWTSELAHIDESTTVLIFAGSGKTALGLVYELKHARPQGKKARAIIAIGSEGSQAFTEGTGLYDKVLKYDADKGDLKSELDLPAESKIILCNFGARDGAADRWTEKLQGDFTNVVHVVIGGEVGAESMEKTTEKFMKSMNAPPGTRHQINASDLRAQAMKVLGEKDYFDGFSKDYESCKDQGLVKGLRLTWGHGMEDWGRAWERLCKGKVGADEGLVFSL